MGVLSEQSVVVGTAGVVFDAVMEGVRELVEREVRAAVWIVEVDERAEVIAVALKGGHRDEIG